MRNYIDSLSYIKKLRFFLIRQWSINFYVESKIGMSIHIYHA